MRFDDGLFISTELMTLLCQYDLRSASTTSCTYSIVYPLHAGVQAVRLEF